MDETSRTNDSHGRVTFGRRQIFTDEETITRENVVEVLHKAVNTHSVNESEIDYLYRYYKGEQPILNRQKDVRPEINNKKVVNRANEIVSFKTGYLVGEPVQYVNRKGREDVSDDITLLNDYMTDCNKAAKDETLVEWSNICGTSYRYVLPKKEETEHDEAPFEFYTLDPRNTFVVRYNDFAQLPVMAVNYVKREVSGEVIYSVYTRDKFFRVIDGRVTEEESHALGGIPIIEYPANAARLGAFEIVLSLLDGINTIESNRDDAIEQFIQALMVFTGANITREQVNELKDLGAIKLPEGANVKYLIEELNQGQTQIKVDSDYQTILTICGMPNRNGGSSTSDTGSAVIMRDGWESAEARAKKSETIFKCSEKEFLRIVLNICGQFGRLNLRTSDVEIRFTRRNYDNIQSKAQVLTTMLANEKIDPRLAFQHCGMFPDPEIAYTASMQYYETNKATVGTEDTADTRTEETL